MTKYLNNTLDAETFKAVLKKFTHVAFDIMRDFALNEFSVYENGGMADHMKAARVKRVAFQQYGRTSSWGGFTGVSFQLGRFLRSDTFHEYKAIAANAKIGTVTHEDFRVTVGALVAHEIAHTIDHHYRYGGMIARAEIDKLKDSAKTTEDFQFNDFRSVRRRSSITEGHDLTWQYIYYVLREEFINNEKIMNLISVEELLPKKKRTRKANKARVWSSKAGRYGRTFYYNAKTGKIAGWIQRRGYKDNRMYQVCVDFDVEEVFGKTRIGAWEYHYDTFESMKEARDFVLKRAGLI